MKNKILFVLVLSATFLIASCHRHSNDWQYDYPTVTDYTYPTTTDYATDSDYSYSNEDNSYSNDVSSTPTYNSSFTIINDIIHTKLDVKFDWAKKYLYGKAWISFKPHFYATDTLTLDAKGFNINKVEMVGATSNTPLLYAYDSSLLKIWLDRTYQNNENYTIFIDYTAKPYERHTGGSSAITDQKGLYFINADGKNADEPRQLWTQGETEYNSAWFPTIDKPNIKHTTEISMTVDTAFVTLSNGLMTSSKNNNDGTRTDTWKMDLPYAPYLTMMAAGGWKIYHDKWRGMDVNYYMEPKYYPYAKEIFGNTPEMMEFYSKTLGVDYAWPKFSQVIVREFVSGAMENVTAVVHYDGLNQTHREMIDGNLEDIIAHELFHHWFGDLVTTESWANLSLNESFADYSETLWITYKYGKDEGDAHWDETLDKYIQNTYEEHDLIWFDYSNREDMFDNTTYEKGGRILGMLRNYIGDSAFFKGLHDYLTKNKFKTAEANDLREAFENITGQDLSWFFNQWYYDKGHPKLEINYYYDDQANIEQVQIKQTQNQTDYSDYDYENPSSGDQPIFILPMNVDVYANGKVNRYHIIMNQETQVFNFPAFSKPDLVNVDADKILLCEKTDNKTDSQFVFQYFHAPLYKDRLEAVEHFYDAQYDSLSHEALITAMNDKFWKIREKSIYNISIADIEDSFREKIKNNLINLAKYDPKSDVRADALDKLTEFNDKSLADVFAHAMADSSYNVLRTALYALEDLDSAKALSEAIKLQNETAQSMVNVVSDVFSKYGSAAQNSYFVTKLNDKTLESTTTLTYHYGKFLKFVNDDAVRESGFNLLLDRAKTLTDSWDRYTAMKACEKAFNGFKNLSEEKKKMMLDSIKAVKDAETDETIKEYYLEGYDLD